MTICRARLRKTYNALTLGNVQSIGVFSSPAENVRCKQGGGGAENDGHEIVGHEQRIYRRPIYSLT